MSPDYRYILSFDGVSPTIVYPTVDGTQKHTSKREDGEVFHRKILDGDSLTFANADFSLIFDSPVTTEFGITQAKLNEFGIYITVFSGVFYRTDCDFDQDSSQVSVQPTPSDGYKKIIEGLDKEFDIVKLAPPKITLEFKKQPVNQFVLVQNNLLSVQPRITNVVGGISYEEEFLTAPAGGGDLRINYQFGLVGSVGTVTGEVGMNPDISGQYISGVGGWRRTSDDFYLITFEGGQLVCKETGSGAIVYTADDPNPGGDSDLYDDWILVSTLTAQTAKFIRRDVYGRHLTNAETVLGQTTQPIPTSDVLTNPPGYTKCLPLGSGFGGPEIALTAEDVLIAANDHTPTPTAYTKIPNTETFFAGEYLTPPAGTVVGIDFPINQSQWKQASFWVRYDSVLLSAQEEGSEDRLEENAYALEDVIQTILTELGTNLIFTDSVNNSKFFFDPTNPIKGDSRKVAICPKSNIATGAYTTAATTGKLKLSEIFQLLWGAYKCKWHIDGINLVVEHIEYYHNGMSYGGPNVGSDLTILEEPKTNLPWAYKDAKWTYDKSNLYEEIRFEWMDNVSVPFKGYPIISKTNLVQKGNNLDLQIGKFTSDIDFIILSPSSIDNKGFFVGEVEPSGDNYLVPIADVITTVAGSFKLQNGYMSFLYLHEQYHKYSASASTINLNLEDVLALSVTRSRIQKLDTPSFAVDDDSIMELVATSLGDGLVVDLGENTDGSGAIITIEHDFG